jgi:hypothetical protein
VEEEENFQQGSLGMGYAPLTCEFILKNFELLHAGLKYQGPKKDEDSGILISDSRVAVKLYRWVKHQKGGPQNENQSGENKRNSKGFVLLPPKTNNRSRWNDLPKNDLL